MYIHTSARVSYTYCTQLEQWKFFWYSIRGATYRISRKWRSRSVVVSLACIACDNYREILRLVALPRDFRGGSSTVRFQSIMMALHGFRNNGKYISAIFSHTNHLLRPCEHEMFSPRVVCLHIADKCPLKQRWIGIWQSTITKVQHGTGWGDSRPSRRY